MFGYKNIDEFNENKATEFHKSHIDILKKQIFMLKEF
jgi:hypothetical protein